MRSFQEWWREEGNTPIWLAVPGFELYEASTDGRVRRRGKRELKQINVHGGYKRVKFCVGGVITMLGVHRIVASTFLENTLNRPVVAHINGIPHDNRADNLYWATHSQNAQDRTRHKTQLIGEKNPAAKLTRRKVEKLRGQLSLGLPQILIAENFGVSTQLVSAINCGHIWRNKSMRTADQWWHGEGSRKFRMAYAEQCAKAGFMAALRESGLAGPVQEAQIEADPAPLEPRGEVFEVAEGQDSGEGTEGA